jgi:hypothetical protein
MSNVECRKKGEARSSKTTAPPFPDSQFGQSDFVIWLSSFEFQWFIRFLLRSHFDMPHGVAGQRLPPLTLTLSLREREQLTDSPVFFKRACGKHRTANFTGITQGPPSPQGRGPGLRRAEAASSAQAGRGYRV